MTKPLEEPLLSAPAARMPGKEKSSVDEGAPNRRSPRLNKKMKKNKSTMKLAQELLAKKWGVIQQSQELDNMTLQYYLATYKKPTSKPAMEAIKQLTEVAIVGKEDKKKLSKNQEAAAKLKKAMKEAQKA